VGLAWHVAIGHASRETDGDAGRELVGVLELRLLGVDPLQATKAIIDTLDRYISTGIGYARTTNFARDYLAKYPTRLK
jgi:hypothetical protein